MVLCYLLLLFHADNSAFDMNVNAWCHGPARQRMLSVESEVRCHRKSRSAPMWTSQTLMDGRPSPIGFMIED
ncbi:hypothetical protein K474DRAFT_200989 [Panus rudis PR-1116 ss-1]|nr:hypothetical protein K474DRAFT_200989 [Panus rudis PR-1116 ss-1]